MRVDSEAITALIRECAAKYIMPRFKTLADGDIESKSGPNDLVTVADRETEIALDAALTGAYPGCVVIGEEGIAAGLKSTDVLQDKTGMIWVVDPVDGTWNFVHGKPEFAVMLACIVDGETRHGWIYDVPADRMLYAGKGEGAHIDGVRQQVAKPKPLADTAGFCGARYFAADQRPFIKGFADCVKALHILGCAGHEYLNVISGVYDFSIYNRGKVWDHLAGTLAVAEAGGVVRLFNGAFYTPQDDYAALAAASNPDLLAQLQAGLLKDLS